MDALYIDFIAATRTLSNDRSPQAMLHWLERGGIVLDAAKFWPTEAAALARQLDGASIEAALRLLQSQLPPPQTLEDRGGDALAALDFRLSIVLDAFVRVCLAIDASPSAIGVRNELEAYRTLVTTRPNWDESKRLPTMGEDSVKQGTLPPPEAVERYISVGSNAEWIEGYADLQADFAEELADTIDSIERAGEPICVVALRWRRARKTGSAGSTEAGQPLSTPTKAALAAAAAAVAGIASKPASAHAEALPTTDASAPTPSNSAPSSAPATAPAAAPAPAASPVAEAPAAPSHESTAAPPPPSHWQRVDTTSHAATTPAHAASTPARPTADDAESTEEQDREERADEPTSATADVDGDRPSGEEGEAETESNTAQPPDPETDESLLVDDVVDPPEQTSGDDRVGVDDAGADADHSDNAGNKPPEETVDDEPREKPPEDEETTSVAVLGDVPEPPADALEGLTAAQPEQPQASEPTETQPSDVPQVTDIDPQTQGADTQTTPADVAQRTDDDEDGGDPPPASAATFVRPEDQAPEELNDKITNAPAAVEQDPNTPFEDPITDGDEGNEDIGPDETASTDDTGATIDTTEAPASSNDAGTTPQADPTSDGAVEPQEATDTPSRPTESDTDDDGHDAAESDDAAGSNDPAPSGNVDTRDDEQAEQPETAAPEAEESDSSNSNDSNTPEQEDSPNEPDDTSADDTSADDTSADDASADDTSATSEPSSDDGTADDSTSDDSSSDSTAHDEDTTVCSYDGSGGDDNG